MEGFGLEDELAVRQENPVGEIESNPLHEGGPDFDGQNIVIPGGVFIGQPGFDYGKNAVRLLPGQHGGAEGTEEFTPGGLQKVQIACMIHVVPDGTFGVSDAMLITKRCDHATA